MNKAFTRESDYGSSDEVVARPRELLPPGVRNYITPAGAGRLRAELRQLVEHARPRIIGQLSDLAAAGRGDDPEHGGARRRLREVDAQIAWLGERLQNLEVVEPANGSGATVRFGARVSVRDEHGDERQYHIVGIDEADPPRGAISWISPIARALLGKEDGDEATVELPRGRVTLEVLDVRYDSD